MVNTNKVQPLNNSDFRYNQLSKNAVGDTLITAQDIDLSTIQHDQIHHG
jgi:hypothetical protein